VAGAQASATASRFSDVNADEPDVADYDTFFTGPAQEALYEPNAYRSSDHDPILVGLGLTTSFDDLCRLTRRLVTKPGWPTVSATNSRPPRRLTRPGIRTHATTC
jgi:hypothetical protein